MAHGGDPGPLYGQKTKRSSYAYFFYVKHHQKGPSDEAQWLLPPLLTQEEEFQVFDLADQNQLSDNAGNLYGLRPIDANKRTPLLGTRGEQVAKFPWTRAGQPWHGFPIWPIADPRQSDDLRPVPHEVLLRMVGQDVIDARKMKRLRKGLHI